MYKGGEKQSSLLNDVLACFMCFTCLACSRAWCTLRVHVLGVLHKMSCLTSFKNLRGWRASKDGVVDVLYKTACLKLLNFFLGVFDRETLVNCRS